MTTNTEEAPTAIVFGLGGLGAGAVSARLVLAGTVVSESHSSRNPLQVLLLPGILFCLAVIGCLVLCKSWPAAKVPVWRYFAAAALVSCDTIAATFAAFLGGLLVAVLEANRGAHSLLFYTAPIAIALVFGGFVSAGLMALSLYLVTQTWDDAVWEALLLSGSLAISATIAVNPQFLLGLDNASFGPGLFTLIIFTYTFYGACAGCWLARSARTSFASEP